MRLMLSHDDVDTMLLQCSVFTVALFAYLHVKHEPQQYSTLKMVQAQW